MAPATAKDSFAHLRPKHPPKTDNFASLNGRSNSRTVFDEKFFYKKNNPIPRYP
jgi:hypothetical protein